MRILLTSNPGAGHIGPLVPFVHAFRRAGDEVVVAAPGQARATVVGAGLPFHALADPPQEQLDAVFASLPGRSQEEQGVRVMSEVFAGMRARASLPGMVRLVADFRPDVVLREQTEYAGLLAAEWLGVRHGRIGIMAAAMEAWGVPVVAPVLDRHRERLGLRPDPRCSRITESPYLTVIPEAMEDPGDLGPAQALRCRTTGCCPAAAGLVGWRRAPARVRDLWIGRAHAPLLRAAVPRDRPGARRAAGARALHGRHQGGARHSRARAAQRARRALGPAVRGHAARGRHDRPRRAGIALDGTPEGLAGLAGAVRRLLDDPSYRRAAQRVAVDVAALPAVDEAPAAVLEWAGEARAA